MKIAVCDDEVIYLKTIVKAIEQWSSQNELNSVVVDTFRSTEDLLELTKSSSPFDIIFIDIEIPGEMSGMQFAKSLRERNDCTQIVFVTNYSEYAHLGYHVNALRYICKPVRNADIFECLDIAFAQWKIAQGTMIVIPSRTEEIALSHKSIVAIEAKGHALLIHKAFGEDLVVSGITLKDMAGLLPDEIFCVCQRSFIVNILYVRRITQSMVGLANGQEIGVGKKHRDDLRRKFSNYYQGAGRIWGG